MWREGKESDKPREECGVFGVYNPQVQEQVADLIYLGLYALQHRGQESAGIATGDGRQLYLHKGMGLVSEVFREEAWTHLPGHLGIGHVRYSTTGNTSIMNAQPLVVRCGHGHLALAHNGNLVNASELRRELINEGSVFQTTTDTEVILNLIARYSQCSLEEAIARAAARLRGGYAVVISSPRQLFGLRDPHGIRPLALGRLGKNYFLSSETCAFNNLGARLEREVRPGELVVIDEQGVRFEQAVPPKTPALCVFEFIYFARPDSQLAGRNVHQVREAIGAVLAAERPPRADAVIAAPDSGTSAAMGFARASGLPFEIGLIKNRYIGRTFIQPSQARRELGVRIKLSPVESVIRGKRIVLIDDSIVRGTTSAKTVNLLREAGAAEVHMYVASPPYRYPCYYGIDTSQSGELIAAHHSVEEIRRHIGADSLTYLSLEGLVRAVRLPQEHLCLACFSGQYPVALAEERPEKFIFEG